MEILKSGYILFETTAAAFLCEKVLKEKNINIKLAPTPRNLSSDCGISAYFWGIESKLVDEILKNEEFFYKIVAYKDEYLQK